MEQRQSYYDPQLSRRHAVTGPIAHSRPGGSDAASPVGELDSATASDLEVAAYMEVSRTLMKRWHNVLRELAK